MHKPVVIASLLDEKTRRVVMNSRKDDYGDGWLDIRSNGLFHNLQALGVTGEPSGQRLTPLGFKVREVLESSSPSEQSDREKLESSRCYSR